MAVLSAPFPSFLPALVPLTRISAVPVPEAAAAAAVAVSAVELRGDRTRGTPPGLLASADAASLARAAMCKPTLPPSPPSAATVVAISASAAAAAAVICP